MSPKWLSSLVRARQVQEDVARQHLADARRRAESARDRVEHANQLIDDLCDGRVDSQFTAPAFVAAAVALQSAAATHSAAMFAVGQADVTTVARTDALREAAIARSAAEKMSERADTADRVHRARIAQRELDETAARVHRDSVSGAAS